MIFFWKLLFVCPCKGYTTLVFFGLISVKTKLCVALPEFFCHNLFIYMHFVHACIVFPEWCKYSLIIITTVCTLYCLNWVNLIVTCAFTWNTFTWYSFSCRCMDTSSLSPVWTSPMTAHCWCLGQRTGTSRSGGSTSETATSLSLLMMTGKLKQIS